jgi:DNA-binding beta-propeller fold protein YncE
LDGPSGFAISGSKGFANNYGAGAPIFRGFISGSTLTVTEMIAGGPTPFINIGMNLTTEAMFTADFSGAAPTMTVTAANNGVLTKGAINLGSTISGGAIPGGTTVVAKPTLIGGPGDYTISATIGPMSVPMVTATPLVTVAAGTEIVGWGTGTGGLGTYIISPPQTVGSMGSPVSFGAVFPGLGSGYGGTISVIDIFSPTFPIIATVTIPPSPPNILLGSAPAALAVSPDGAFVYSANYQNGNLGTGTVSKIRVSDNTLVGTLDGFSGPFFIVITSDGTKACVTNFGSNCFAPVGQTVGIIDLTTFTILTNVMVGIQPAGIAITPDNRFVYVSNYNTLYLNGVRFPPIVGQSASFTGLTAGEGTVQIIDLLTNVVVGKTIVVGASPSNIAITPNGKQVCVANFTGGTVSILDI